VKSVYYHPISEFSPVAFLKAWGSSFYEL
jgi:hypothetical protein